VKREQTRVAVGDRELTISNLDKVLFPESGFTKGQLIDYYVKVAPLMLPHIEDRPVTLRRYPHGVESASFYAKHVPPRTPGWVRTITVPGQEGGDITYPVVSDVATLVWTANLGAIEFHVPLWRAGRHRKLPSPPDLIVFDLDPGDGTTVVECCSVAVMIADLLEKRGLECRAKTSGSKGMQVYAGLTGRPTWEKSRAEARSLAEILEHDHPDVVTSKMRKALRNGKVLIDWSQNHRSKTTIGAYSVRGRPRPTVSTPVTWKEVERCAQSGDPATLEFTTSDVLARMEEFGDLFSVSSPTPVEVDRGAALEVYRSKRDPSKTPEPMGGEHSVRRGADPIFVVQEHHARSLHWDFRLEHDGVLASWALPKGVPEDPQTNHLAIHTEDHPLSYASFTGEIPRGEYGAGTVRITDSGTYELEKWRPAEIMVRLQGTRFAGRYVLFATEGNKWMIHRMDPAGAELHPLPSKVRPMLATPGTLPGDDTGWAYEIKWDGVRAIAFVDGGRVRLQSRNDKDLTAAFPEFQSIGHFFGSRPGVLDGEIVVIGDDGKPDFGRLQHRLHLTKANVIEKLAAESPATYVVFDLLHLDGRPMFDLTYDERRRELEALKVTGASVVTADSYRDVEGAEILRATREADLEGIVAKRRDGRYAQGERAGGWIKVKNERMQEVVIGGWTEGSGSREGSIGALLLGLPGPSGLRFVGKVGTGFSDQDRRSLFDLLGRSATKKNPFHPPDIGEKEPHHFVRPGHVGEVRFSEWTSAGRLRHPSWRGMRSDKRPADISLEEP
jgi:bifunctional non-homologous end joining protein LigD